MNGIPGFVDVSKIEAGMMELDITESDINQQLDYIYTFFKPEVEAKGMKLFFKNPSPVKKVIVKTDREKLFAILSNLVKNAIRYCVGSKFFFTLPYISDSITAIKNDFRK